jgi:hypothetical protein
LTLAYPVGGINPVIRQFVYLRDKTATCRMDEAASGGADAPT